MELAINYSPQAAALLAEGKIDFDRFKCADWPDMIADASRLKPVYVHFPLQAGLAEPQAPDLDAIAAQRRQTHTPFVNTHLIAFEDEGQSEAQIEAAMMRQVRMLIDRFGAENTIAENIPYYSGKVKRRYARASVDAALITRVIERSGCGLLLDLSHARIAARNLGIDARQYIESLPVERLRELHVTGIELIDGRLADHMGLGEEDWAFLEWAMQRIAAGDWARPWCVAFEYGGVGEPFRWRSDQRVIEEQMPRMAELVRRAGTGG